MKSVPLVTVLYPNNAAAIDLSATLERAAIGDAAEVRSCPMSLRPSSEEITSDVTEATALILWHSVLIDRAMIDQLRSCRAIIRNGTGYDSVDIQTAAARKIAVCNVPDYGTEEVADHAIALTMALCRQLFQLDARAKNLGWGVEVAAKLRRIGTLTFGVIGLGRIGTATALRAKALGFRVVFYDPYSRIGIHKAVGIGRCDTLDELLQTSDVISIHCPLTVETHGLIGERELALMKPSTFLVNTARGDVVRKAALFQALRENRLAGAGMDVIEDEPLRTAEEAATPNLIATCHAAFCSQESMAEMRTKAAQIARAVVLGQPVWNRVN